MWTQAHRARHDARLKEIVSLNAVAQVARWLERVDPPRSGRATPYVAVVRAIAWHLRVGGSWRALPGTLPAWRTVYGWFRKELDLGLFDRLLGDVARRRRRAMGRRAAPRLSIIDTQAVKCIPVRGPRGYDAAKKGLGRKRVALVDADGTWMAPSRPRAAKSGRTGTACVTVWSSATPLRQALSCARAAGLSSAASAGLCPGAGCCGIALAVWTSPPRASRSPPPCPASRLCSTRCLPKPPQVKPTQTVS